MILKDRITIEPGKRDLDLDAAEDFVVWEYAKSNRFTLSFYPVNPDSDIVIHFSTPPPD